MTLLDSFIIRVATVSDIDQLVPLRILMQKEVHREQEVPGGESEFLELTRKYYLDALPHGKIICCVAESAGRIVSNTLLIVIEKAPSFSGLKGRIGYVSNVYTLPEFRGQGLSTALMEKLKEKAREAGISTIMLNATDAALSVYMRTGFTTPRQLAMELRL